jgi:hypothetical protein
MVPGIGVDEDRTMRAVEDLIAQVRDPRSREHFAEAVRAYGAGAYRAAIISTWVTVALDLMSKIRQLAEDGEAAARTYIELLDNAIAKNEVQQLQKFERSLLDESKDTFELIDARDHIALRRLYDDRHVCAHPAFVTAEEAFEASPELVRAHLATAVDSVLRHGVTAGQKALDRFKAETEQVAWPGTHDALVAYLRERYLDRGKAGLRRNLAILAIKGVLNPGELTEPTRRRLAGVAHAIDEIDPLLLSEALVKVVRQREEGSTGLTEWQLAQLVGSLGDLSPVWAAFPPSSVPRVVTFIETAPSELLEQAGVLTAPVVQPAVATAIDNRLTTMDDTDLARVLIARPAAHHVRHALRMLSEAGTWRTAESRMQRIVLPTAPFIEEQHLEQVLDILRANSEVSLANGMPHLLGQLFEATVARPGALAVWERIGKFLETHDGTNNLEQWHTAPELRVKIAAATATST